MRPFSNTPKLMKTKNLFISGLIGPVSYTHLDVYKRQAKGLAEGRAEAILATARNLKSMGFPTEDISRATGLTIEDILNILR